MPLLFLLLAAPAPALKVPDGFEVSLVAGSDAANDVHCMTLTPDGRIVVAGRGYVRLLADDGKVLHSFAGAPKDGAMGLLWEMDDLYCVGDGGLKVWRDAAKQHARPPITLFKCKTGGEHTAHALRRGPDGWMYFLVGDGTGITAKDITGPKSPIKEPVAGCVLRFSPDWKQTEVYAHGFRNAYGMDFGTDGELYTYDSDNERCVSLPWYEGTRFYRVRAGGHHGWFGPKLATTWRMPPHFFDVVAPVADLGRGSPTGVAVYKHAQFPARYRGGAFLCDWTFGVVHFVPLPAGKPEVFLRPTGDEGFAPVSVEVHPKTGDLYVAIGGRGTRGAVYRVRHAEGLKSLDLAAVKKLQPAARPPRYEAESEPRLATLVAVRGVQRDMGGPPGTAFRGTVWEGYTRDGKAVVPPKALTELRGLLASKRPFVAFEAARTLALAEDKSPDSLAAVAALLKDDSPTDDVHYLICLARLKAPRGKEITAATVRALVTLEDRLDKQKAHRDLNWPPRLAELHAGLAARDPAFNDALIASPHFGHPGHVAFTRAKGIDRPKAAALFLAREGLVWNAELVHIVGQLPAEKSLPVLRALWGVAGLDEELVPILARHASGDDHPRLLAGLLSARLDTVRAALGALEKLAPRPRPEAEALFLALRQLPSEKAADPLRARLTARLEKATGVKHPTPAAWAAHLSTKYPDLAPKLRSPDGVDEAAWAKRLAAVAWDRGDAARGAAAFTKASCAACHGGAAALGPDLVGIAGRFSRDDLFTAIIRPSKDVAERYRTTRIATEAGQVYQGIVAYEAVDSVLLLTGPAATIRIANKQIASKQLTPLSLMPTGLLDRLTDAEIADLYAHLRSLKK